MKRSTSENLFFIAATLLIGFGGYLFFGNFEKETSLSSAQVVGKLTSSSGIVSYRPAGSFIWKPVSPAQIFREGDAVRTDPGSLAEIKVGERPLKMSPESMVILRRSESSDPVELVFGEAQGQFQTELRPTIETVKVVETEQQLWWYEPKGETFWTTDQDQKIDFSWGALRPGEYEVSITDFDGKMTKQKTTAHTLSIPTAGTGTVRVRIKSLEFPGKFITKTIAVRALKRPQWKPIASNFWKAPKRKIEWEAELPGQSEVRIYGNSGQLLQTKISEQSLDISDLKIDDFKGHKAIFALVRVHTDRSNATPWSEPLFLAAPQEIETLSFLPKNRKAVIDHDWVENKLVSKCLTPIQWDAIPSTNESQFSIEYSQKGNLSQKPKREPVDSQSPQFCPTLPGSYEVRFIRTEPDGTLSGISTTETVSVQMPTPGLADESITYLDDHTVQLKALKSLSWPITVETQSPQGRVTQELPSLGALWSLPEGSQSVRYRFNNWHGEAASSFSAWKKVPPRPMRQPASIAENPRPENKAELPRDPNLFLRVKKTRPIYMTDWQNSLWTQLEWSPLGQALYYEVQTSSTGLFDGEEKTEKYRTNRIDIPFQTKNHFFWRVRAVASEGSTGPWSDAQAATFQSVNSMDVSVATRSQPQTGHPKAPPRFVDSPPSAKKSENPARLSVP